MQPAKNPPMLFLKAVDGRRVKDPKTFAVLAPDGEFKPDNSHWRRQLMHGDVVETVPPVEAVSPVQAMADAIASGEPPTVPTSEEVTVAKTKASKHAQGKD